MFYHHKKYFLLVSFEKFEFFSKKRIFPFYKKYILFIVKMSLFKDIFTINHCKNKFWGKALRGKIILYGCKNKKCLFFTNKQKYDQIFEK